jgi:transposase
MKWLKHTMTEYEKAIDELAKAERYQKRVNALVCYHGIKNIFAMVMITEIGDINRFAHPNQLTSWLGFDIREYSSGGKHHRFGITKHGNRYLRTAFVEANQRLPRSKRVHPALKARRKEIDPELVHIADRCLARLTKKGNRLLYAGKHPNKVKVACAREMVGFVWESLRAVA